MVVITAFLVNLLCAMVPCDYNNPTPEILQVDSNRIDGSDTGIRGKRLIEPEPYPIVNTTVGAVKGYMMTTMHGRKISAFEGIPYAENPLRFRPPVAKAPWNGIRNAFKPGPFCLQMHVGKMFRVLGASNCLTLQVYTPRLPIDGLSENLPVIVFIHGGSFTFGSGAEYGPSMLLDSNVILVTINYRVGVMGFLSTGDEAAPGNYGLKDQALALKWVNENIAQFGGDPNRVTLMGQSAGSVCTHLHMISNVSREYFQAGIPMSGTGFSHWGVYTPERARSWTNKIAKMVRCPTNDSYELVACLRRTNDARLVGMQMNLFDWMPFPPVMFAPVIEPEHPEAFISEPVEDIYERDGVAKIPAIFSMTAQEGHYATHFLNAVVKMGTLRRHVEQFLPIVLDYKYIATNVDEITQKVLKFYLGNTPAESASGAIFGDMGTDRYFIPGIQKAIKAHYQIAPTYTSIFDYVGKYNLGTLMGVPKEEWASSHTEDVFYYLNASSYITGFKQNDPETKLSTIMINLLTNFVSRREPIYSDESGKDVKIWDAVNSTDLRFLHYGTEIGMIPDPFVKRVQFWESLGLEDTKPLRSLANSTVNNSET